MPTNQAEERRASHRLKRKEGAAAAAAPSPPSTPSKKLRSSSTADPSPQALPPVKNLSPKSASGKGIPRSAQRKEARPSEPSSKAKELVAEGEVEQLPSTVEDVEEQQLVDEAPAVQSRSPQKRKVVPKSKSSEQDEAAECYFLGDPVPLADAKKRWPERYSIKNGSSRGPSSSSLNVNEDEPVKAAHHYLQASIDNCIYNINDDAYVKAGEGEDNYIGRIIEFFKGDDHCLYFTAQWFFRPKDTVIKELDKSHDKRRVFLSEEKNDNVLDCIVSKVKIIRLLPNIDLAAKEDNIPPCDLYYDMSYSISYSTFANLPTGDSRTESGSSSVISSDGPQKVMEVETNSNPEASVSSEKTQLSLLDMYSGCGAMSTGLCLGASRSNIDLTTRWAVDVNSHACKSLKLNHPQAEVRNETAENFLSLIKEWEKMCQDYSLIGTESSNNQIAMDSLGDDETYGGTIGVPSGEFEVGKIVGICFGDPHNIGETGIKFKVRWKGYGPDEDTWEPKKGLSKCEERIANFVREGYRRNFLPLPGGVDVICGGPPCQGISGFNRFRRYDAPLEDPKNQQMVVFMDIVDFLKPKYVLMENVVDILKFAGGFLGRYALSRLVQMNYQARLGIMAAGSYGLPQFRMRCFLWGAQPSKKLPSFPLPTHDVVVRGGAPTEFEQNIVAYDEKQLPKLEKALLLGDAISDLPSVNNNETRDETTYRLAPKTEFQRFIRLGRHGERSTQNSKLFDHMPLQLNEDDYQRVCQIPKRKGANFRNLPGVKVGADNIVEWDADIPRVFLPSGKPLVPDYAMSFIKGKSSKPFARLWWDETVPTVVTRAEPHNQAILHPEQDRVLTIRENARLQGFPDYYRFSGPVKERYIQVGNAVAVPVSRALGYALGAAYSGEVNCSSLLILPSRFPLVHEEQVPHGDSDTTVE